MIVTRQIVYPFFELCIHHYIYHHNHQQVNDNHINIYQFKFSIYHYIEQLMNSQIIIINNSKNRVHLGLRESVDPSCSSTAHINCTMRYLLLLLSIYFITNYIRSISIHPYIHHHHHIYQYNHIISILLLLPLSISLSLL